MSEPATMSNDAKQRVKEALSALASAELRSSHEAIAFDRSAGELDPDSSYSVDDLSQSDEDEELSALLGNAEDSQEAAADRFDQLDFGPKTAVAPGAIIAFGGDHYVVGVVAPAFECDGVTYEGISPDAPIYPAIEGLRAGDTFTFNGHEHRIDLVA